MRISGLLRSLHTQLYLVHPENQPAEKSPGNLIMLHLTHKNLRGEDMTVRRDASSIQQALGCFEKRLAVLA